MKTNVKRLLSLALCLVLALSLLPMAALAATPAEIVEAAYALQSGEAMEGSQTLTGKIIKVNTPYDSGYKNVTVTIEVEGCEDKPIMCYRLKGDGVDTLTVDDTITVTGTLKNYNGTIEFDAGCTLDALIKGDGEVVVAPTDPIEIVKAAYALEKNEALPYMATLTGKIISIDSAYSEQYKNITVTIAVPGAENMPIECFRLKGEGAETLVEGNTITVTGLLKRYYKAATADKAEVNKIEFDTGCTLDAIHVDVVAPTDPVEIVKAAYALEKNEALPYKATLTGKITAINTAYSEQYKNITVTIAVPGAENMPIECYRLKGEGAETLVEGNTITVTGTLKHYYKEATEEKPELDKIEFDAGCTLDAIQTDVIVPTDPVEIVKAAYALEKNEALPYKATLTGVITAVNTPYSEQFKNVTVTIAVPGAENMPIECYRMKGNGADTVDVGDTITVTGTLKRYYKEATEDKPELDKIEFDTGCTLDAIGGTVISYQVSFVVPEGVDAVEDMTCGSAGITLPTAGVPAGEQEYVFVGWTDAEVEDSTTAPTIYTGTYNAQADTTLYALYSYTVGGSEGGWKLVTDVAALAAGDSLVLADKGTGKVASEITKQFLSAVDAAFSADGTTLTLPEGAVVLTLNKSGSVWTLANAGGQLLGATTVKKLAWDDGITSWTIEIDENAAATITNSDSSLGRFLYNVNSPRFTTYTSNASVSMVLPQLYKLEGEVGTTYYTTGKAAAEEPQGVTVSGKVDSARGTTGTITVELWAEGAEAATYTATTEDGNYTIEGVAAGTYTMKVSKANHVTREYTVTVGAEAVAQDAKICLIGDVTGDGRVNAGDVAKLFTHVKGGAQLTDEYVLACANANGRALNISDVATIYAHVKGSKMLF